MGADICYLEKSRFLADSLVSQLPQLDWFVFDNEADFLKNLLENPPLLLIIGDTGTSNAIEILYCLKSLSGFGRIPIIFYGENEFSHILPVNRIFPRNSENFPEFKSFIIRHLKKSRQSFESERADWKVPEDFSKPGFQRRRARSLLKEEMFRKHLFGEIAGINITDISFNEVLEKLCVKLLTLLSADFVFITYLQEEKYCGRLFLRKKLTETDIQKIRSVSLKNLPSDAVFFQEPVIENTDDINPAIILSQRLSSDENEKGGLGVGSFHETANTHIPENIGTQLAKVVGDLLEHAARYYQQVDETRIIYKAFSQFLPAPIIDDLLLKESEKALLTGEKRRIVVLFSHIRNFDIIVEKNEPQKVVGFLNSHFTNMVRIIQNHGGSIDKFIGDAVFAIFGAPISYIDNTERAAEASIEMIQKHKEISTDGLILPGGSFSIGVGLHEGEAIIGNIGCADKFDYTAIGDTVNLAARLESLTKHYRQDILISRVVYQQLQKEYYCRLIDRAKVKGKNEATEIFSLLVDPSPYSDRWKQTYSRGLKMYSLGNWFTAEEYLRECLRILPDDIVCEILLKRCVDFQQAPPEDWVGAVALDFK